MTIDLNSDLGESYGAWSMGDDAAMLAIVSSANVACGFHAGHPAGILETLHRAAARGVVVGAHVSYPDRVGFGRRDILTTLLSAVTRTESAWPARSAPARSDGGASGVSTGVPPDTSAAACRHAADALHPGQDLR